MTDLISKNTFSTALDHLKGGGSIARAGWHGKGMFAKIEVVLFNDDEKTAQDALILSLPNKDRRVGWLPSVEDLLASDWILI